MFSKKQDKDIFSAYDLFIRGRYTKALKEFEEFYALHPDSTSSLNMVGIIYTLINDKRKAESAFLRLIEKFEETQEYDKIFPVINKMAFVIEDHDRLYQMRANVYSRKNRNELSVRELLTLAERYRHAGNFDACNNLYMDIATKNPDNYRLISKVVQKMSLMGAYSAISDVLKKSTEHNLFPEAELDHIIVFLIESGAKPENVMPFIRDFLLRHPESFGIAEPMLIAKLRKEFDAKLFTYIVSVVPLEQTREFTENLKEFISDVSIIKHMLLLEAPLGRRDIIKGLIFELYVEGGLSTAEIAGICKQTQTFISFEETIKLYVGFIEKKEIIAAIAMLADVYRNAGEDARADAIAVYAAYNTVPDNFSEIFSNPPENPTDIEHRLDVRTSVKETTVAIEPEQVQQPEQVIAEAEPVYEIAESSGVPSEVKIVPLEVELHSYEPTAASDIVHLELDTYNDFDASPVVSADIVLSDDFGLNSTDGHVSDADMSGLETFFRDEPISESEQKKQDVSDFFGAAETPAQIDTGFAGFDDTPPVSSADAGFSGFGDDKPIEEKRGDFFAVTEEVVVPEIVVLENTAEAKDIFEGMLADETTEKLQQTVVQLDFNEADLIQASTASAPEDMFAGMEEELRQKSEPEQEVQTISFDEKELKQVKNKSDDFFSQEI